MREQTTIMGKPQVSGLLPPGDTQLVGTERIRFSVLDLRVVIGAELRKVDQLHQLEGSPTSPTPAEPAGLG